MSKKIILAFGSVAALTLPIATVVSCSLFSDKDSNRSKLEFYNYEDYIADADSGASEDTPSNIINQSYHFTTFGDLPDFENYIVQERTIGGIGSDYFNASLAERNYLRKIDFQKVFPSLDMSEGYDEALKQIYTPEAWAILDAFTLHKRNESGNQYYYYKDSNSEDLGQTTDWNTNKYHYVDADGKDTTDQETASVKDVDGDGVDDKLWEFMIPYFAQNKVIAFNPFSSHFDQNKAEVKTLQGTDQSAINDTLGDPSKESYEDILQKLSDLGASTFANNDYMRDNMMIGSEKVNNGTTDGSASSVKQGKKYLDAYKETLSAAKLKVTNVDTSGTGTLSALLRINGKDPKSDVAMMYNGDALFGYYAGDVDGAKDGELRFVTPKNSTYLLDGVILVKSTSKDVSEQNRFYNTVRDGLYRGVSWNHKSSNFASPLNKVYSNFDFVNYTPAFKNVYDYVTTRDNYFDDANGVDANMLKSTATAAGSNQKNIKPEHQAQVTTKEITDQLSEYNSSNIAVLG